MSTRFTRMIQDFKCENCGVLVKGNGYTNHCPACLYSQHVDNYPGDRAAACRGLMPPTGIDIKKGEYIIVHQCLRCGIIKRNKVNPADNMEKVLEIVRRQANAGVL